MPASGKLLEVRKGGAVRVECCPFSLRDHGNIRVKETLWPLTRRLFMAQNSGKSYKPGCPPVQATSSGFLLPWQHHGAPLQ